jgi:polar amino acid transport system substrate-binding protein
MPRRLFALPSALLASVLLLAACGSDSSSTADGGAAGDTGSDKLIICSDVPYEPMEFEADPPDSTPSGYTGFNIDLVQAIADGADKTLEVKATPFDGIFAAMDAGNCAAVVSSVTITDERKKNMNFTEPYFDSDQSILVLKKNESTYPDLASLEGKKIGVQSGTTGEEYVKDNTPKGATVTALPGAADLFAALEAGTIEAVVQDYPINAFRTTQSDNVVVTARIATDEKYGMATPKKNGEATLVLLNEGIETAKADGTYDTLYEKYFGEKPPPSNS